MLETAASNRANRRFSMACAGVVAGVGVVGAVCIAPGWVLIGLVSIPIYFWLRRKVVRRIAVIGRPSPSSWPSILQRHVAFYVGLDAAGRERFEKMMRVFLCETRITGIRTDVDETTRVLVAASAIIPVFGFDDFEYAGLGEVLIYPDSFDADYQSHGDSDRNILGMVGTGHLSGVMILSKPSLIAGFRKESDKQNVGIHEFAHLVDDADGRIDGLPLTSCRETSEAWVRWVGEELRREGSARDISDYAYTNEAEYFAVLSEYFFESPAQLERQHPQIFAMMKKFYHQDPRSVYRGPARKRRRRVQRNDPCPCGSGEKFKHCCRQ